MKLPVKPKDSFQVVDANDVHICFANTMADRDKIIIAINSYEKLVTAIEEAKVKRGQYREIIEALLVPTNFIGIEAARDYICEALETYGLGKIEQALKEAE